MKVLYNKENKEKKLWKYLPRKQKNRRKKNEKKTQKSRIPNRVSKDERPNEDRSKVYGNRYGKKQI